MVSTEEMDWILDQLGYYIILDGGKTFCPDMDNYWKVYTFLYKERQNDNDIVIENSEADGKTYFFNVEEFKLYEDDFIDELVIEPHQAYTYRMFLHSIYMPKYWENKIKYDRIKKITGLIDENPWIPKVIKDISERLTDNKCIHTLHYSPKVFFDEEYEDLVYMPYGKLEIFEKFRVFNPYKFCGGYGDEFEYVAEMTMTGEMWKIIKKYIITNDHQIDGKEIDLSSNPHYRRVEFIDGSDVPISGRYE